MSLRNRLESAPGEAPSRPFTVAQVLPALDGGGAERGTLELAAAIVRSGGTSIVISAGGRLVEPLTQAGSEHYAWTLGRKTPLSLRWVPRLRALLLQRTIDVLHVRSRLPAWICHLALRRLPPARRPIWISTFHGAYSVNRYSEIMLRTDRVIAVSGFIRRYILEHFPRADSNRITVIPRGINAQDFPYGFQPTPAWRTRWQQEHPQLHGKLLLTLPGRISRRKGIEDFIELIDRLKAQGLPAHGLILGAGKSGPSRYFEQLHGLVAQRHLQAQISFLGFRSDIREILSVSRLAFSLSQKPEAFGRAPLEALSLGVPVVGYDHGGVSEILQALFPQGRCPPRDQDALAETARKLLQSGEKPPSRSPFPLSRMLTDTLALYAAAWRARD